MLFGCGEESGLAGVLKDYVPPSAIKDNCIASLNGMSFAFVQVAIVTPTSNQTHPYNASFFNVSFAQSGTRSPSVK